MLIASCDRSNIDKREIDDENFYNKRNVVVKRNFVE